MVLDGERLSYRTLDVEQIGSVYEAIMGFRVELSAGRSIAIRSQKRTGASVIVDLDGLLAVDGTQRTKLLKDHTDRKLTGKVATEFKKATTVEDVVVALDRVIDRHATPHVIPPETPILQPTDERRRSGSHYTPRSLTQPVVFEALRPVLERLGERPHPEEILQIKVLDPATGSGAFLVEACRQLGEQLVKAWSIHGGTPDKLVEAITKVAELRRLIQQLGGEIPEGELQDLMDEMDLALRLVRQVADLVLLAFFEGKKNKERNDNLAKYAELVVNGEEEAQFLIDDITRELPFESFHWELEFPEVFDRKNSGFDAVVGNPPFAGKNTIATANHTSYPNWLKALHSESHGNADQAAHFFRRVFNLLRRGGTLGLIATNTIAQGDTRSTGLRWICEYGGQIYRSQRRFKWPGEAAVIVSIIHAIKGKYTGNKVLDGKAVDQITAFLFHGGGHNNPNILKNNCGKSFQGSIILGMGFTFDDADRNKGVATPIAEMKCLVQENHRNQEVILPYIGGKEVNTSPSHFSYRYVINFQDWPLRRVDMGTTWTEADTDRRKIWLQEGVVPLDYSDKVAADYPDLLKIIEQKVKPGRDALSPKNAWNRDAIQRWWQFLSYGKGLHAGLAKVDQVLVISQVSPHFQFTFLPSNQIFSCTLILFLLPGYTSFAILQSRLHEVWTRFFGSSLKDDLRYTPSECFQTFPMPKGYETFPSLEEVGKAHYNFRAELMIKNDEGMTKTYNRFHNPEERSPEIFKLRTLHAAMDRAVLDAYGWIDIPTDCKFLLDYEIDEETWGNKKKPYRYRWPDEIHDEVLARLLDLNAKRYEEECLAGKQ